ncbi:MAG TPA: hypothetical protein VG755_22050 [Nannocystaceae bacterium]|nr:hypothetical protein [Nannocystaceae bacterium]
MSRLLMCALSEALAPDEDGELRVITSRSVPAYFFVVDPSRPGRCAGGFLDDGSEWRFFHGRYDCAIEELDVLEQVRLESITPAAIVAFAEFLAPADAPPP